MYDEFLWNSLPNAICDDDIFIAICINDVIGDETWWPTI
jgi:hypothetical protein